MHTTIIISQHEFDYGEDILRQHLKSSTFPWYGSNVYDKQTNQLLQGITNMSIHSIPSTNNSSSSSSPALLKVGIFGITTTSTPSLSNPGPNISFQNIISTAQNMISTLKKEEGVHIVVALTHVHTHQDELLVKSIPEIDLVLGGHDHDPVSFQSLNSTLVLKCGQNGYWVGQVDLDVEYEVMMMTLQEEKVINGGGIPEQRIKQDSVQIYPSWYMHSTRRVSNDPMIDNIVLKYRTKANEELMNSIKDEKEDEPFLHGLELDDTLATIVQPLNHHDDGGDGGGGGSVIVPLDTRSAEVRRRETTSGNLIADAMLSYYFDFMNDNNDNNESSTRYTTTMTTTNKETMDIDVLAMINGGFIRGDRLYPIDTTTTITLFDILEELPFPRTCTLLDIADTHLLDGLEQQLSSIPTASGAFPHVSNNVRLVYNPKAKVGSRIVRMSVNGCVVERGKGKMYRIIVTDFVASGGDGCSAWCFGLNPLICNDTNDDGGSDETISNKEDGDGGRLQHGNKRLKFVQRKISTIVIGYLRSKREIALKLEGRVATCT
uniref:5'-Nucleotidase C-terminal domain-containing protein n=1 Tax=Ditylum brightwellii TaxID=49249 RepID=A0A6V2CGC8_9STRA